MKRNPKIQRARKLYRDFNEVEPQRIDTVRLKDHDTFVKIGPCTDIAYLASDGNNYIHRFKKGSRPVLCVSADGRQLILLQGKYRFTDRGIVDL